MRENYSEISPDGSRISQPGAPTPPPGLPPLGTGSRLSEAQPGQERAAGPQMGAGEPAHRRLSMGGHLFWAWGPDGLGMEGGGDREAR